MENNPNMLDSLFVPTQCILHSTSVGNYVRDNRKLFLSKAVYHKYRGYAHSNLSKCKTKYHEVFNDLINYEKKYTSGVVFQFDEIKTEMINRNLL
jgi:hypothetical protein